MAVGTISYGVYVYHMVIAALIPAIADSVAVSVPFPVQYGYPRLVWMVVTTIPVAALSWRWFERPLNDLKEHYPYVPASVSLPASPSLAGDSSEASSLASRAATG